MRLPESFDVPTLIERNMQKYFNPKATEEQILKVSHAMVSNPDAKLTQYTELKYSGCTFCYRYGPLGDDLLLYRNLVGLALRAYPYRKLACVLTWTLAP